MQPAFQGIFREAQSPSVRCEGIFVGSNGGKQRLLQRFNFVTIRYGFHKVFVGNQVSFGKPSELKE